MEAGPEKALVWEKQAKEAAARAAYCLIVMVARIFSKNCVVG